jgi:hypothetical protein
MMKTVMTGTEYDNLFWLRDDNAADPTIHELARVMREARKVSAGVLIYAGEYHLPYLDRYRDEAGALHYGDWEYAQVGVGAPTSVFEEYSLQDAIKVSAARCAAVSFRNVDYGLEKCLQVHERLVGDDRKHASALEHQCSPMAQPNAIVREIDGLVWQVPLLKMHDCAPYDKGTSHIDAMGQCWSGNMRGYVQYRKLIPGENYTG